MPGAHPFHAIAEAAATAAIENNPDPARGCSGADPRAATGGVAQAGGAAARPVSAAHSVAYGWPRPSSTASSAGITSPKPRCATRASPTSPCVCAGARPPPHPDCFSAPPRRHGDHTPTTGAPSPTPASAARLRPARHRVGRRGTSNIGAQAPAAGWSGEQVEQSPALVKAPRGRPPVAPADRPVAGRAAGGADGLSAPLAGRVASSAARPAASA